MAEYLVNDTDMTKVADAIRAKGNTTDPLSFPDGMAAMINSIQSGGGGVEEVDISFIRALNNSNYDGRMVLNGMECDFSSNGEYTFELNPPVSINKFFTNFVIGFLSPFNNPTDLVFDLSKSNTTGQYDLVVRLRNM